MGALALFPGAGAMLAIPCAVRSLRDTRPSQRTRRAGHPLWLSLHTQSKGRATHPTRRAIFANICLIAAPKSRSISDFYFWPSSPSCCKATSNKWSINLSVAWVPLSLSTCRMRFQSEFCPSTASFSKARRNPISPCSWNAC